jgi:GcrA cell cycle regulator
MRSEWSNERIEQLKALWAEGETAAAIATHLGGISRSAVLGKVFRLRLCPVEKVQPRPTQHDFSPTRRRSSPRREHPREHSATPAKPRGKSVLELTNNTCRWPHGRPGTKNFHFCGALGADLERGMPYCAHHAQRAYLKNEEKTEKPDGAFASNKTARWTPRPIPQTAVKRRFFVKVRGARA